MHVRHVDFRRLPMVFVAFAAFAGASLATPVGVTVPAPLPAQPVVDTHWGVAVPDPYRFLEDTKDPRVQSWLKAQANATEAILTSIPGRAGLLTRMKEIEAAAAGLATDVVRTEGNRFFFERRNPTDGQFKLVWRDGIDGADTVIVDPEALSTAAGRPHAIMDFAPSRDGRFLAYAIQVGGGEIGTLHVIDVASGKPVIEPIDRIRYASTAWLEDGSGFFYSRLVEGYEKLPQSERFGTARAFPHHRAATSIVRCSARVAIRNSSCRRTPRPTSPDSRHEDGRRLSFTLGVERNRMLFLADLASAIRGDAQWRKVVDLRDKISTVAYTGGWLYLRSSKSAPRYQVLRMPLDRPDIAKAETVIHPVRRRRQPGRRAATAVRDAARRRDAVAGTPRTCRTASRLRREPIALPFAGNVGIDSASRAWTAWWSSWAAGRAPPGRGSTTGEEHVQAALRQAGAFDAPHRHRGTRSPCQEPRRGRSPDVHRARARTSSSTGRIRRSSTATAPMASPKIRSSIRAGGVDRARRHLRFRARARRRRLRRGMAPGRTQDDQAQHLEDVIAATEWLIAQRYTVADRARHLRRQRRRHPGWARDHRAAGSLRGGRAVSRHDGHGARARTAPTASPTSPSSARWPRRGRVSGLAGDEQLSPAEGRHEVPGGDADARRQRHPRRRLAVGQVGFAARDRQCQRPAGAAAARIRVRSRPGQHARAGAAALGRHVGFMLWQFGVPEFQPKANP